MEQALKGKKVAILVANGFEKEELIKPKEALEDAGAIVEIVSPEKNKVKSWVHDHWEDEFDIDIPIEQALADDYIGLVLPGGVINPDILRMDTQVNDFISAIFSSGKPIAAICHGPLLFINSDIANGYRMTSWASIKQDLMNAGAEWLDEEVIVDGQLVTSRKPDDIPAFNKAMIDTFTQLTEESTRRKRMPRKYDQKAQQAVEEEMHEFKRGRAKSGVTKKPVKNREQAIAIGLSKARKKGAKVPKKPSMKKRSKIKTRKKSS